MISVGWVLKFVPYWSPPKRNERPHEPPDEIESPTRSVTMRSGKSRVHAVSSRVAFAFFESPRATAVAVSTPFAPNRPNSTKPPAPVRPLLRSAETS